MKTLLEAIKQLEEKQIKAKANRKSVNYQVRDRANSEVYYNRSELFALYTAWYIVKHNADIDNTINQVMEVYKGDQGWNGYGDLRMVNAFTKKVKELIENEKALCTNRQDA